ncbi:MAG: multiheme c-type cytochrome [Thermodesulfobacteriota bacterium]
MAKHNWIGILQSKDASKPAQPGGCGQCHPGLGAFPTIGEPTEADFNNIDCLICHAPNYRRAVAKVGDQLRFVPAPGVDVLKVAQGVQKPTSEMCLRCHAGAGGGINHKHGVTPTKDTDIHMAKGMECQACHKVKAHKIAGGSDLKAQELLDVKIECSNCHTAAPHKGMQGSTLNDHTRRIACQTCHIPAIARDPKQPTVTERDWTKPVYNEGLGLYVPTNKMGGNLKPIYRWWNHSMKTVPEPVGSIGDSTAKIFPWKKPNYILISDTESAKAVYIKAGVYSITGDPAAAAQKGAGDAKQSYSGKWKPVGETPYFSLNHQVAPKSGALQCNACHNPSGVLDFKSLGYPDEQIQKLMKIY